MTMQSTYLKTHADKDMSSCLGLWEFSCM